MGFLKFPKFRVRCETDNQGGIQYTVQRRFLVGFWWEWDDECIYTSSTESPAEKRHIQRALAIAKMEELILMEARLQGLYKDNPRTFYIYPKKEKPNGE